jgi:hypothetical protein
MTIDPDLVIRLAADQIWLQNTKNSPSPKPTHRSPPVSKTLQFAIENRNRLYIAILILNYGPYSPQPTRIHNRSTQEKASTMHAWA